MSSASSSDFVPCPQCGRRFLPTAFRTPARCRDCDLVAWEEQRVADQYARNMAASGVAGRHAKFSRWEELTGPAEYMACVAKVRRFLDGSGSVMALIGKRGTGKTQVCATAVMRWVADGHPSRIVTAIGLIADLKRRYGGQESDADGAWLREWGGLRLLAIDEIAERLDSEHSRVMLTAIVDHRYRNMVPTIIVGNVTPDKFLDCVGGSIADRCNEGGGVVCFDRWPSFRK